MARAQAAQNELRVVEARDNADSRKKLLMKKQLERVIGAPADDDTQLAWSSQLTLDRRQADAAKQKMGQVTVAAARDAMQLQLVGEQRCNGAAVQRCSDDGAAQRCNRAVQHCSRAQRVSE